MVHVPTPQLPPGFRFHPTDGELVLHYLMNQAAGLPSPVPIIAEVDIYKFDPWELPCRAVFGEKEWYFFSPRDRKYPNGARPNRAAGTGYWKATGTDKPIVAGSRGGPTIGVKKALVFYKGKPPKGMKTDWIMHEYRLADSKSKIRDSSSMRLDDWVLCRIYKKSMQVMNGGEVEQEQEQEESAAEETVAPAALEDPFAISKSSSLADLLYCLDGSSFSDQQLDVVDEVAGGGSFYQAMDRLNSGFRAAGNCGAEQYTQPPANQLFVNAFSTPTMPSSWTSRAS